MKKSILSIMCCSLLLLAGCNNQPTNTSEILAGNEPTPAWSDPTEYDYSSSMTAVVKVDLLNVYPESAKDWVLMENDRLAAFIDDVCCGVAVLQDDLFWLYITEPQNPSGNTVTLRYYSAHFKNIFEADNAFSFENDSHQGSITEPLRPTFKLVKKQ